MQKHKQLLAKHYVLVGMKHRNRTTHRLVMVWNTNIDSCSMAHNIVKTAKILEEVDRNNNCFADFNMRHAKCKLFSENGAGVECLSYANI